MSKAKIVGLGLLVLVGLPIVGTVLSTFTSVVSAPGRVINKTLQTDNIISNYEWYHDAYGAWTARVVQVGQFQDFLADETNAAEKRRLRIELAAIQQACRELAERYNANSRKINRSIFKGTSTPAELDLAACG